MKLKTIITIVLIAVVEVVANAQTLSPSMEKAISVCQELSKAIENSSTAPLKAANVALKAADIVDFGDRYRRLERTIFRYNAYLCRHVPTKHF